MPSHGRKLDDLMFDLGGTEYRCQVLEARCVNNSEDGEKIATFCPDGDFQETGVEDWSLEMVFLADWRAGGISDFLWTNDGLDADFQLDMYSGVAGEHVRWSGTVRVKAPTVGGEAKTTERTEVTLRCSAKPIYTRV